MVKSLIDFQTLNRYEIKTTTAGNMKTCGQIKVGALILNLASKISYVNLEQFPKQGC